MRSIVTKLFLGMILAATAWGQTQVNLATQVKGTLPLANGGTNATSATAARTSLSAAKSGANSDITSLSALSTPLSVAQGGSGLGTFTLHALLVGNSTSALNLLTSPSTNGNCLVSFNVTGSAAVDPTCATAGVAVDATNPATLLYSHRAGIINWTSGSAFAMPAITGLFANSFPFAFWNHASSSTVTMTPNAGASDTCNGSATCTVLDKWFAFLYSSGTAPGAWISARMPTIEAFGSTCTNGLTWSTSTGIGCAGSAPLTSAFYQTVQQDGTPQTQRGTLNLISGSNSTVTCVDNSGSSKTDCTIASTGGGGGTAGATLFSTTGSTTATAASATSLIGTVSGSTTVPVNTWTAGAVTQFFAEGYYTDPVTPRTLTIDLKIGGTTRITTGAVALIANVTNGTWRLMCMVTTRTAGVSGTQIANCIFETTGATLTPGEMPMQTASTWTIDTTATQAIDLQATWDATTGSPSITSTNVAAWIPGAPVTSVGGQTGAVAGQGNGTKVQMSTGSAATSGDLLKADANGNSVDAGVGATTTGWTTQSASDNTTHVATTGYVDRVAQGVVVSSWCNSTVGTANATEYNLAPNGPATNIGLCTATGASTTTVATPLPIGCTAKNMYAHAGAAGAVSGSGVIKLYKNGSATALTCTLGTGTTCNDTTHTAAYVAGDTWSTTVTTGQATDSTSGVKVSFQCL